MYHLKFYADCPETGLVNKLFCYQVHDGKHACDLLARFLQKAFKIRAAFLGRPGEKGQRVPAALLSTSAPVGTAGLLLLQYPPRLTDKELSGLKDNFYKSK